MVSCCTFGLNLRASARPAAAAPAEEEYDEDDLGGTGNAEDGEETFAEDGQGSAQADTRRRIDVEACSVCKCNECNSWQLFLLSRPLSLANACALLVCRSGDESDRAFDEAVGALEEMLIGNLIAAAA